MKSVTQKLKSITQEIPQQAILRKTGIIAEEAMSEAQKEAAKHKTARISLSDAMGVAPVKSESAPLKTIRIKRPLNLQSPTSTLKPMPRPDAAAAPATPPSEAADAPAAAKATEQPAEPKTTVTQRKTLKIARPGGSVRPAGKFGLKRPAVQPTAAATPAVQPASGAAAGGEVADIADIPDIPGLPPVQDLPAASNAADIGPAWAWTLSSLVQAAACIAIGALAWFLYQNTQTMYF